MTTRTGLPLRQATTNTSSTSTMNTTTTASRNVQEYPVLPPPPPVTTTTPREDNATTSSSRDIENLEAGLLQTEYYGQEEYDDEGEDNHEHHQVATFPTGDHYFGQSIRSTTTGGDVTVNDEYVPLVEQSPIYDIPNDDSGYEVTTLKFSKDGSILASAKQITIRDRNLEIEPQEDVDLGRCTDLDFSHYGCNLATANDNWKLNIFSFDPRSRRLQSDPITVDVKASVESIAYSLHDEFIYVGGRNFLYVYCTKNQSLYRKKIRRSNQTVKAMCASPTQSSVVIYSVDNHVFIHDVVGNEARSFQLNTEVLALACTTDGQYIYAGGKDAKLYKYSTLDGTKLESISQHLSSITSILYDEVFNVVIVGDEGSFVTIYGNDTNKLLHKFSTTKEGGINSLDLSPDNMHLAVVSGCHFMLYEHPLAWNDIEHVLEKVQEDGNNLQFVSTSLRNRFKVVIEAVQRHGESLKFASMNLRNNVKVARKAVGQNGLALKYVSEELKDDTENGIVQKAIETNGAALKFAPRAMKSNQNIVYQSIQQDIRNLAHASTELKNDVQFMQSATQLNSEALAYASERLKNDANLLLHTMQQHSNADILKYATSEDLKDDQDFILQVAQIDHDAALEFASPRVQNVIDEIEFEEREMRRLNSATSQAQEGIESTAPSTAPSMRQNAGGETGEEESQVSGTRIHEDVEQDHQDEVDANYDFPFVINNHELNLPRSGKVLREVAEAGAEFILHIARNGIGEDKASNGSLVIFGSREEDFENPDTKIGYATMEANRFYGKEIYIQNWRNSDHIHSCFVQDGAIFVDGQTGVILADHFNLELRTEHADQGGGLGQKNASAAGMRGCLAIKTKKDSCAIDGVGKGQLVVFPGQKTPVRVDVAPSH